MLNFVSTKLGTVHLVVEDRVSKVVDGQEKRWDDVTPIDNYVGATSTIDKSLTVLTDSEGIEYVEFMTRNEVYISTTHFNELSITLTDNIKNTSGDKLSTPISISFYTENPDFKMVLDSTFTVEMDERTVGTDEQVLGFYGAFKASEGKLGQTNLFITNGPDKDQDQQQNFPASGHRDINDGDETWVLDKELFIVDNIPNSGWLEYGFNVTEIDDGELVVNIIKALGKVAGAVKDELPNEWKIAAELVEQFGEYLEDENNEWYDYLTDNDDPWTSVGKTLMSSDGLWNTNRTMYKWNHIIIEGTTPQKVKFYYKVILWSE